MARKDDNVNYIDTCKTKMREYYKKFPMFTDEVYNDVKNRLAPQNVHSRPEKVTHRVDVVIAGGGPIGVLYARGLQLRNLKVLVIEPEPSTCMSALNVSQEIFNKACNTFDRKILEDSVIGDIGEDNITFYPAQKPNYQGYGVLNVSIDAIKFLKNCYAALQDDTCENQGIVLEEKVVSYKKYDRKMYVITDHGSVIECFQLLHDMGPDDFISRFINYKLEIDHVPTVGVEAHVQSGNPSGSLIHTLMNAVDGYQDVWEFLADKNASIDQQRLAIVYLFTRYQHDTTIHDLDRLAERFFKLLHQYSETEIVKLDRFLFGDIVMVRDFDKVTRSIDDNIRLIGFFDFSNPSSGAHFEEQLKESNLIMDQITRGVIKRKAQLFKRTTGVNGFLGRIVYVKTVFDTIMHIRADYFNPLSKHKLEKIRSSRRQQASTKLTRAFSRAMDAEGRKPDSVNSVMTMMLKMYECVDNPVEKARMLYNMIPPGVAAEFFFDLFKDGKLKYLVIALKDVNDDLGEVVGDIIKSYTLLLLCEIGEAVKHIIAIIWYICMRLLPGRECRVGKITIESNKMKAHLSKIHRSHPEKIVMGGLMYMLKAKKYRKMLD